jgi:hypothetical protein
MKNYHINLFYSDADKGYIADIPDLDACSAFGKTPRGLETSATGHESLAGSGTSGRQTHPQTELDISSGYAQGGQLHMPNDHRFIIFSSESGLETTKTGRESLFGKA